MDAAKVHYGATLFVEPETREGRILTEPYLHDGIAAVDWILIERLAMIGATAQRHLSGGSTSSSRDASLETLPRGLDRISAPVRE